jgi:transcriptional antiterminator RfaH
VPYWCAQLEPQRERLALHVLAINGYEAYLPRVQEQRIVRQRKVEFAPPLFPGYCFIVAVPQWHVANYSAGVRRLILDGGRPASVGDGIVAAIRSRERNGLVELPKPPRLRRGDAVRVLKGPFAHHVGLYHGMKPRDRVEVLLSLLGGSQRVTLSESDVEPCRG